MSEVGAFEIPSCRHGDLWSQAGSSSNTDSPLLLHPQAEGGAATIQAAMCWCSWLWLKKWSADTFYWTSRPGPLWNKLFQILEVGLNDASIVPLTSVYPLAALQCWWTGDDRWPGMWVHSQTEKKAMPAVAVLHRAWDWTFQSLFEAGILFPTCACTFSPLAIPTQACSYAAFNLETSVAYLCILPVLLFQY